VSRPRLEVAEVFHRHGATWRRANAGHVSLAQLKVMSAIEQCRSAALGGHVERCQDCGHSRIAYNSCRNRHCPKCQGAAAKDWLAAREADLLPVGYFHLVFTLPAEIAPIAYQNKAVVYDLLFRTAAETLLTIAADPRHLGARIGFTAVLHTWGSAMTPQGAAPVRPRNVVQSSRAKQNKAKLAVTGCVVKRQRLFQFALRRETRCPSEELHRGRNSRGKLHQTVVCLLRI
jgi:Transposase zinc-binding domain